jgi:hypothetical protein
MTGEVVWVSVVSVGGIGTLHTGVRCEAFFLFLFLTVSFLPSVHSLAYEDGAQCSETSVIKHHTPGNNPKITRNI